MSALTFSARVREHAAVFNANDPETVIGYAERGNWNAAGELLCTEALVHESCMNQRTADAFYALADYCAHQAACHLPKWRDPDSGKCEHPDHDHVS